MLTSSTGVGTVVVNGVSLTDEYLKADAFNNYFSSVSLIDDGLISTQPVWMSRYLAYSIILLSHSLVMQSTDRLKSNSSAGPPVMYKRLKQCLSVPLTMLYNQSLSVGYVCTS